MKTFVVFFLMMVSFILSSDVLVLDADNFEAKIADHELLLVEFYAPWCGHCKKLAPEYETAATKLKESGITIANLDADNEKNRGLAGKYGIRGFPTLKVFRNGEFAFDYQGPRDAQGIINYMKKLNRPEFIEYKTLEEAQAAIEEDDVVIISFVESETFKSVAKDLRTSYAFGVVSDAEVAKGLNRESDEEIVLFKKFDERRVSLKSTPSAEELTKWIKESGSPLIGEIGPNNYADYVSSGNPLVWLFLNPTIDGQVEENLARYAPVAKETRGKLTWIWIDSSKYLKQTERVGLSGKVVPALAIDELNTGKHFGREADLGVEDVQAWVKDYFDGKLEPTIRSEDIPETNDGPVTVVVAKTFDEIVLNSGKDVLLEFYAPWCGHCKSLAPIYEELGEVFMSDSNVVIAKIDATANDVNPAYEVRGFPTIKFFPAGQSTPITFDKERTLEPLKEFVTANRKTSPSA